MQVNIHNKSYTVKSADEFKVVPTLPPFEVKKGLSDLDRQIYLLNKMSKFSRELISIGYDHGFYVPLNCSDLNVTISCKDEDLKIAEANKIHSKSASGGSNDSKGSLNIVKTSELSLRENCILRLMEPVQINVNMYIPIIMANDVFQLPKYTNFLFVNYNDNQRDISLPYNVHVYVHDQIIDEFRKTFRISETGNIIDDNLLNLLVMVKNAGDEFSQVLDANKGYADHWTFLDTGSTDNTVSIINNCMKDIPGELYQEPFINFRDSRNRCLQLAGEKCHFNIMLDDTYILNGDLRPFLYMARGDDYFDSFSLYIKDVDITYSSNRITKAYKGLKYVHLLHEVIENNVNGAIPDTVSYIRDKINPYMTDRTKSRKEYDLKMLFQDLEENPTEPRTLYYIAETYLVLQQYDKALEFYKKRAEVRSGYNEEVQDSLYKVGVLSEQFLGCPWEQCHQYYLECFNYDTSRAESLYLIGDYYYKKGHYKTAYMYLSSGYSLGVPRDRNMNIRLNIYCYHLPLTLAKCCLEIGDFALGEKCIKTMEEYKNDSVVSYMKMIFNQLVTSQNAFEVKDNMVVKQRISNEKTVVFVIDGGWEPWDGETLGMKGLGGSESFVIKYSETLKKMGYNVLVFCNCAAEKRWNNVVYVPIGYYASFISKNVVDVVLINRYPEYVPVSCINNIPTYLIMHDLPRDEDFLWNNNNFKGILCISDWHSGYMKNRFPHLADKVNTISYGIDINKFKVTSSNRDTMKIKKSFIYSSFPNRGLLPLLQIFSRVVQKHPDAILHVFCDTKHKFVQQHFREEMAEIDRLIGTMKQNVINHGWVNPLILNMYWSKCKYWFYPCKFLETCCLTAYEAAASHTLAITNNLAALEESVGDRGIIQPGDPMNPEWQDQMTDKLNKLLDGENADYLLDKNYEWIKTKSFDIVVKDFEQKYIK